MSFRLSQIKRWFRSDIEIEKSDPFKIKNDHDIACQKKSQDINDGVKYKTKHSMIQLQLHFAVKLNYRIGLRSIKKEDFLTNHFFNSSEKKGMIGILKYIYINQTLTRHQSLLVPGSYFAEIVLS